MIFAGRLSAALFVVSSLVMGSAWAGPVPAVPSAAIPQVRVTPLRDAGGLPGSGKLTLNLQLTQGLVKYLTDQAQGRYTVIAVDGASAMPRTSRKHRGRHKQEAMSSAIGPQITLEGELSHVQTVGGDKDAGPYFCTLRLFQDAVSRDAPRRLTHGWVALARTYLDLTSNLSHDPRVDSEGLLGELARRVIADVTVSATSSPVRPNAVVGPAPVQILDSADGVSFALAQQL